MTFYNGLVKIVFIFFLTVQVVFAHGLQQTNKEITSSNKSIEILEYFISEVNAKASVRIDEQGGYRYIESDGLADHTTGQFPNSGNPHSISKQDYNFRVPLSPKKDSSITSIQHANFGVAINGIPFDPATAEYWNNDRSSNWNIEALTGGINLGLDKNNAHVQPNGAYHYHSIPVGLLEKFNYRQQLILLGYAADGFPIYSPYSYRDANDETSEIVELKSSYRIKQGMRPDGPRGRYDGTYSYDYEYVEGAGDLDKCNGRIGITPEYKQGTYYYVITKQFPFIPRCWVGSPDSSFQKSPGNNRGQGRPDDRRSSQSGSERRGPGGPGRRPPQEAIKACSNKSSGSSCSFKAPHGTIKGKCRDIASDLACAPDRR